MERRLITVPYGPLQSNMYVITGPSGVFIVDTSVSPERTEEYCKLPGLSKGECKVKGLLLTHGHRYSVKSGYDALLARAVEVGADIVVFGHTHVPFLKTIPKGTEVSGKILERPTYLFNPGSVSTDPDGLGLPFGTLFLRGDTVLFSHGRI